MDDATVFEKSKKGRGEIDARARSLHPKARALLVMVDGKSTVADLEEKAGGLGNVREMLGQLLEGDYIRSVADMSEAKLAAVQFLEERLGPDAMRLCLRLEESRTPAALAAEVEKCCELLTRMRGAEASADFRRLVTQFVDQDR